MYHLVLIIIACCILNLSWSFSTDWSTEFSYNTYIDEDEVFKLYWTNLENDVIEFGMEAAGTGWIAIGISPNGQMPNSDIHIGWVDDYGNVFLQDRYTEARSTPLYDSHQNLTIIEGEESDGMTRIRFKRNKFICNEEDVQLEQGTTRVIWAFHEDEDPMEECFDSNSISMHTNKGSQSLNLETGVANVVELEDDVQYIDILMDEVQVPSNDTTYYCKLFKLPEFDQTQHVVKFEPIVEEGNEGTVHHLLAYECAEWLVTNESHIGAEGLCDRDFENMPARECTGGRMNYAWAIGGGSMYLPKIAGLPLGGDSSFKYIMMQIHYDNPEERDDIVDSSGFRMWYTSQLREEDAGILSVGAWTNTLGQFIPGGLEYAHTTAFMHSECSNATFPDDGINVFATILHQHTIGVASNLRLIRDGEELEPIDANWAYDFDYQAQIEHDPFKVLYPGDSFILDCYIDSSERDYHTYGGEPTKDEMCFVFLFYYPVVQASAVQTAKIEMVLGDWMMDAQDAGYLTGNLSDILKGFYEWPYRFDHMTYNSSKEGALEFYNRLWDPDYPEYDGNYYYCLDSNGSVITNETYLVPQPSNFTEYDLDLFTCDDEGEINDDVVCTPTPDDLLNGPMSTTEDPVGMSGATNHYFKFVLMFVIITVIFMFV